MNIRNSLLTSNPVNSSIELKLDGLFEELKEIGVTYLGHGVIDRKGNHTGYFSQKDWGKNYIEKGYFYKEPILNAFDTQKLSTVKWSIVKKNDVYLDRKNLTGSISGITLKSSYFNVSEYLNIGLDKDESESIRFLSDNSLMLKHYFLLFRKNHTNWHTERF